SVLAQSDLRANLRTLPVAELLEHLRSGGMIRDDADHLKQLVRADLLRTLPGANLQGDGFFAAVFVREA
ncbi:MAG TPA: hypothetical protein VN734_10130, partial [Acidobacteriaceae bacterium]|nr:hypothetical protein [Acidobacteriaceae bacterium]